LHERYLHVAVTFSLGKGVPVEELDMLKQQDGNNATQPAWKQHDTRQPDNNLFCSCLGSVNDGNEFT